MEEDVDDYAKYHESEWEDLILQYPLFPNQ